MSTGIESKPYGAHEIEAVPRSNEKDHQHEHVDDLKTAANFKADAIEAESAEHAMSVVEAAKAYPMACLWAFIMSSTIVSCYEVFGMNQLLITLDHGSILCFPDG
jgi:SP family general alpha glucoside:H+ symporter-like MFS transporter